MSKQINPNAGGPPKIVLIDMYFEPNKTVEFGILGFTILFYIPALILYIKNRDNIIIKYRQPNNVISAAILSGTISILTPIIRCVKVPCLFNTWIINSLVFSFSIITFSRYIRTYFMQRLSIFKLRFGEKKAKTTEKEDNSKMGSLKNKDNETKDISLKAGSFTKSKNNSSFTYNATLDNFGIIDPVLYFKRLNSIINKKITVFVVIFPVMFIIIYTTIITITNFSEMKRACVNEHKVVGTPKLVLNILICVSSLYLFYQAYIKQKWDKELKIEYTTFVIVDFICTIIMQLTVHGLLGDNMLKYRVYIFHVFSAIVHLMCVIEPVVKVLYYKIRKVDLKLTEEEFLYRLNNSSFKAQVKDIAIHTFCVENILFFEAHLDLMNMVINYYVKKNNTIDNSNGTFSSSDILHKNTINPVLYKPFELTFKPQFEKIYNLYIKEEGIASVNINASTVKTIEEQMENNNYSYLMFSQAVEEIGELLYSNIYPRMKFYDE
ncbi:hypothetical protein BCR36DRAFT_341330 [Piromyces finnis]|uniref:RGS domain-containing protein n=1 Tax=Piromyces finnis TaxID=1754191 RepID=A0A1Y1VNW9_9FUNG|nr:hypothetical protein BCR36DRAFT_341330 [Piromyces finnis]|eukprot:ORX61094.1 hypothetical protein BCR36DRAFT_341330 [Piromyces finnis]